MARPHVVRRGSISWHWCLDRCFCCVNIRVHILGCNFCQFCRCLAGRCVGEFSCECGPTGGSVCGYRSLYFVDIYVADPPVSQKGKKSGCARIKQKEVRTAHTKFISRRIDLCNAVPMRFQLHSAEQVMHRVEGIIPTCTRKVSLYRCSHYATYHQQCG